MIRKVTILLTVVLLMAGSAAMACGDKDSEEASGKAENAAFEGTLVCLGCDLNKADGARAECTTYGHKHALKTPDGKYVNLLENKYSADLLKGEKYSGKTVKVSGMYYADANQLDVESFAVDGKKTSWCDHCKAMDGCMAMKGGM
jgi:hypothetical protein